MKKQEMIKERKFNGKTYKLFDTYKHRRDAEAKKIDMKRIGLLARIIEITIPRYKSPKAGNSYFPARKEWGVYVRGTKKRKLWF